VPTERVISLPFKRIPRQADAFMVPRPAGRARGLLLVDATWGTIRPIELAPGVRTVGELEVIAHLERGLPVVDSRLPQFFAAGSIPARRAHTQTGERVAEFDPGVDTVLFCNGPRCVAPPDAIAVLLTAGYPAARLLYYRGGMHDWLTLGLPVVAGR
jgi:rhodanese-related sulfurtransferase